MLRAMTKLRNARAGEQQEQYEEYLINSIAKKYVHSIKRKEQPIVQRQLEHIYGNALVFFFVVVAVVAIILFYLIMFTYFVGRLID